MKSSTLNWILLGVGGYLLYRFWQQAQGVVDAAVTPLANAYVNLTSGGNVSVSGNLIFPDGSSVPLSQLYVDNNMHVQYNGKTYTVTSRDSDGNYHAA
jgi:hypothetical protein